NLFGHVAAQGRENLKLLISGQPGRGKLGALEIARDALVLSKEDVAVDAFEIEREIEGTAQARIGELRASGVEHERLHQADVSDRKFFQNDALLQDRREAVSGRPVSSAVLGSPVEGVGLEGLEFHGGVAKIVEPQFIEIVLS